MPRTKVSGIVLDERPHIGNVSPPNAFADRSRWANNGTHTAITWVKLPSGLWVRSFNGTTSSVLCTNNASFNVFAFTVFVWCKPNNLGVNGTLICRQSGSAAVADGFQLRQNNINTFFFAVWNAARNRQETNTAAFSSVGLYLCAAGVFNGTTIRAYLNAVPSAPVACVGISNATAQHLYLGRYSDAATIYFAGTISMATMFNYALSAAQIRKRFEATRHLFGV